MKFSPALLLAVASADDKKVPPRHPLQRLERLTEFSEELLDDWYAWLPSKDKWVEKFKNNAERMKKNFKRGNQRCGYYDEDNLPHGGPEDRKRRDLDDFDRYDREDPCIGTRQITTGFRKWAERYLAACSGQKTYKHQVKRMNLWNEKLQAHLGTCTPSSPSTSSAPFYETTENVREEGHFCGGGLWTGYLEMLKDTECVGDCCIDWCQGTGLASFSHH